LMMAGVTLLLFVLAIIAYNRQGEMKRGSGLVLILTFIGYSAWLGTSAV